jgi:osmotically-inducible protein OsmY
MKLAALLAVVLIAVGCSQNDTKSPDVGADIRASLDQAGFKDVTSTQDRAKGVVTLGGHVTDESAKRQAESIAGAHAAGQVVSNQIAVIPVGDEKDAKAVNSDLDAGIEKNLDAALIQNKLHEGVKFSVKNHVVTLTGEVNSQDRRTQAEGLAASVPNVQQVVNERQVKAQTATSTR